eukprot:gene4835-5622_t
MEQKSTGFLTDTIRLLRAERALKKLPRYVGKKMYIYSTISFFDDGRIFIMLQHPSNPKYVDNYQYGNGKWSAAGPQQLSVMDDVQGRLVPLTKLKFVSGAPEQYLYFDMEKRNTMVSGWHFREP